MLIVAPNIEKIECEGGLDSYLKKIFKMCRIQKIPIVFSLSMTKLGLIAKAKGTKIALLGILKCFGSESLFNIVVENATKAREFYYKENEKRLSELRLSPFLEGSPYLVENKTEPN